MIMTALFIYMYTCCVTLIHCRMRKRSAKDDSLAIGLVNSQSMTSGIAEDNPVFINTSATDESKLRFEHLEEDMEEEEEDIEKDTAEL